MAGVSQKFQCSLIQKTKKPSSLELLESSLKLQEDGKCTSLVIQYADIAGYDIQGTRLNIYSYPRRKPTSGRRKVEIVLDFDGSPDQSHLSEVTDFLDKHQATFREGAKSKPVLVLVNPCSGPGNAQKICQSKLLPLLKESGISSEVRLTTHRGYASSLVQTLDLENYSGIVVVSGDGLIYEVYNGLVRRKDWVSALQTPVGVVAGGSGNAMSINILSQAGESFSSGLALSSCYTVATHRLAPLDLTVYELHTGEQLVGCLSLNWGIIADIVIESERLRALGSARFTLYGLSRIIKRRTYAGELSFLPVEEYVPKRRSSDSETVTTRNKVTVPVRSTTMYEGELTQASGDQTVEEVAENSTHQSSNIKNEGMEQQSDVEASVKNSDKIESDSAAASDLSDIATPLLNSLEQRVPSNWVTIREDFISVSALTGEYLDSSSRLAPDMRTDSGYIQLVFMKARGLSRAQMLKIMGDIEKGRHIDNNYVEMVKVKAFRLVPLGSSRKDGKQGHLVVDGEEIQYGPIQAQILPGVARFMASSA